MDADVPSRGRLFCFGLGYCAQALGSLLAAEGWSIAGTERPPGTNHHSFDRGHPLPNAAGVLAGAGHLLVSVPPDEEGDPVLDCHRFDIMDLARGGTLKWIAYLSTTGVYGDHQGGWVDETTPTAPTSDRSRYRVAAENAWLQLGRDADVPVQVFRLAGIYGPGRSQIDAVRAGKAHRIHKPDQLFSRIHVDDVAGILRASIAHPRAHAIYNVCDDEAAAPDQVIAFAAEQLGVAPPPRVKFDEAELSPMARSFYADNKRVRNQLLKTELGYTLIYPTYREGLAAIARA
jgi:nucleoside-diphosphate-sugar epimerase